MRSISSLFSDSWSHLTSNLNLFVGIYAIPVVLGLIGDMFFASPEEGAAMSGVEFGFAIVVIVMSLLGSAALTKAIINPEGMTIGRAYEFARKYFWSYLLISILVGLAVLGGFILLIIPAFIFGVWFSFSLYVLLAEDKRGIAAMKASREYVRGHWWGVFGRGVLFGLILFALLIVVLIAFVVVFLTGIVSFDSLLTVAIVLSYVFNLFLTPFSLTFGFLIYKDLKALKDGSGEAAEVERVQDVAEAV